MSHLNLGNAAPVNFSSHPIGSEMDDRIIWRRAKKPKRNGLLEHRFAVRPGASNSQVADIFNWLLTDNERHGMWHLPRPESIEANLFGFQIWEDPADAYRVRQARNCIAMFKLSWCQAPGIAWREN